MSVSGRVSKTCENGHGGLGALAAAMPVFRAKESINTVAHTIAKVPLTPHARIACRFHEILGASRDAISVVVTEVLAAGLKTGVQLPFGMLRIICPFRP